MKYRLFSTPVLLAALLLASLAALPHKAEAAALRAYLFADEYIKHAGEDLVIGLVFNRSVVARGQPAIKFNFSSDRIERKAVYAPDKSGIRKDGSSIISFVYRVQVNEASDGLILKKNPFDTSEGRLQRAGKGVRVTPRLHKRYNSLPVVIDGVSPRVESATVEPDRDYLDQGESVLYKIRFSEDVIVTGLPHIPVEVVGPTYELQDKAWFDRQSSSPRDKVFRWNTKPGDTGDQRVTFGNRIEYDEEVSGRIYDKAGNELENPSTGRSDKVQYLVRSRQEEQPQPEQLTEVEEEEEEVRDVEQISDGFELGISAGVGLQGLTSGGDDKNSNQGYRFASSYQPMLEATLGYNFHAWPSRMVVAATLSGHSREFESKVEYVESNENAKLDSDAVNATELFAGLTFYWKPAPTGLGGMLLARQKQFILLERTSTTLSTLIDVSTLAYGLGADYHFDLFSQRWGLSALAESQQAVSSSNDDNAASKALKMGLSYELGLEWLSQRISAADNWRSLKFYYGNATASTSAYDYTYQEAGLKFTLHF